MGKSGEGADGRPEDGAREGERLADWLVGRPIGLARHTHNSNVRQMIIGCFFYTLYFELSLTFQFLIPKIFVLIPP